MFNEWPYKNMTLESIKIKSQEKKVSKKYQLDMPDNCSYLHVRRSSLVYWPWFVFNGRPESTSFTVNIREQSVCDSYFRKSIVYRLSLL